MQIQSDLAGLGVVAYAVVRGYDAGVVASSGVTVTHVGTGQFMVTLPGGTPPGGSSVVPGVNAGVAVSLSSVQLRDVTLNEPVTFDYIDADPYNKLINVRRASGLVNADFSIVIFRPTSFPVAP